MKSFYIFLNIFLVILALLLLAVNFSFKPYPPDKILTMAPVLNETVQATQKIKSGREEVPDIASLWENNLFSAYRSGEGGPLLGPAKPTGMELLGVCSFGDVSGAIIIDKQASATALPQPGRLRNRGISSPAGGAAGGNAPRFYKLGEQLENGFTLSEINSDSVVLSRGREQIVLKLEFEGESSISRNAAAAEAAAAAAAANVAVKIEQPPQNAQPETPENPGVPVVPGVPNAPPAPGATGTRGQPETPAVAVPVTPGTAVSPGLRPRVQPPLSRRQRLPNDPANAQ